MENELVLDIEVAGDFNARSITDNYARAAEAIGENQWRVTLETPLHGLAMINSTDLDQVIWAGYPRPVDPDGWVDWTNSGPDEWEMSAPLLPRSPLSGGMNTAWRYDHAWGWDPDAPNADPGLLAELGLNAFSANSIDAAAGKGSWVWKAVKFGWKHAPVLGDPRVDAAIWLTRQGWKVLQQQSVAQRARMEKLEFERRIIINLNETRRQRLEQGSESSRRKARQYYNTLDALIRMNS